MPRSEQELTFASLALRAGGGRPSSEVIKRTLSGGEAGPSEQEARPSEQEVMGYLGPPKRRRQVASVDARVLECSRFVLVDPPKRRRQVASADAVVQLMHRVSECASRVVDVVVMGGSAQCVPSVEEETGCQVIQLPRRLQLVQSDMIIHALTIIGRGNGNLYVPYVPLRAQPQPYHPTLTSLPSWQAASSSLLREPSLVPASEPEGSEGC